MKPIDAFELICVTHGINPYKLIQSHIGITKPLLEMWFNGKLSNVKLGACLEKLTMLNPNLKT